MTPVEPVGPVPLAPVTPVAPVAPVGPVTPVGPVPPVTPVGPVRPVAPICPEAEKDHPVYVPEPPVTSTTTIIVVPEKEEITPSMKLAVLVVYATRTRWPRENAVAVEARLVVNDFAPVPTVAEDPLVSPE